MPSFSSPIVKFAVIGYSQSDKYLALLVVESKIYF
jgi:hypothetical protein